MPKPVSIFLVDDDEFVRATLSRWLTRQRCRVRTFETGESMLGALAQEVPDLILLDLRLPGLSGFETLQALHQTAPNVRVIMMTAYCTEREAAAAMKQGAVDVIFKSGDLRELETVLAKLWNSSSQTLSGL